MTNPIQPSTPAPAKPVAPAPAAKPSADKTKPVEKITRASVAKNYRTDTYGSSPIQRQIDFSKGGEGKLAPVKLIPLSGRYKGIPWEIGGTFGIAITELSQTYGAEWSPNKTGTFAPDLTFSRLTEEKFSLTVTFYDPQHDILHLTEGIKHLREISGQDRSPPILIYRQGSMKNCNVVLTDVSTKFSETHPGSLRGFAMAEATLSFLQYAGPGSANAQLGAPLTSTPQNEKVSKQSQKQRILEGRRALVDAALGDCLSEKAQAALTDAVVRDKLEDVATLNNLDDVAFVTLAIGKKISGATLGVEPLASKLRRSLALTIAQSEDGVAKDYGGTPASGIIQAGLGVDRTLAEYYLASDADAPGRLAAIPTTDLQAQAAKGRAVYQSILTAILQGRMDLAFTDTNDPVFDTLKRKSFQCASQLALVDIAAMRGQSESNDPQTINKLLNFVNTQRQPDGKLSDANLKAYKDAFGLTDDGQVRQLVSIMPVSSRADFVNLVNAKFGKSNPKISGLILFSRFTTYTPPAPGP